MRSRDQRLIGAIHFDEVRTPRCDPHDQSDDAGGVDDAGRPFALEARADLVEPDDAAESVEDGIEGRGLIAQNRAIEAFQTLRDICTDLRRTPSKILGDLHLRFGSSGDPDRTFDGDSLDVAERS
jgi:hypothetical protein